MADLSLTLACDSPTFEPLWDGTVRFDKIDLKLVRAKPHERHERMRRLEFDVAEYSSGNYLNAVQMGLAFTAVPIFPLRLFRQRDIWVNRDCGIESPQQLHGKRIGIQQWSNSALVWQRALLQHDYGLDLTSVEWVSNGADDPRYTPPAWARITRCPPGRTLEQLVAAGETDAMLLPHDPQWDPGDAARVRRLIEDYAPVEQDYFRRTGLFPVMHTVVVKNALLAEHPWVADSVFDGLRRMLDTYVERNRAANVESPLWPGLSWAEQEAHLGRQPYPSGLEPNRAVLQAAIQYSLEQGVITQPMTPDQLFQYEGRPLAGVS